MDIVEKEHDHGEFSSLRLMDTDGIPQGELRHFLADEGHVALGGADFHFHRARLGAEDEARLAIEHSQPGIILRHQHPITHTQRLLFSWNLPSRGIESLLEGAIKY